MGKKTEFVLWVTAVGILAYWSMVFAGLFPVEELVPGYSRWFLSFPLADAWIAATAGGAAWLGGRDRRLGAILAAAAGSGLVFLGLYAFSYGVGSGLIRRATPDEYVEIAIKIYCLTVGAGLIVAAYRSIGEPPPSVA